MRWVIGLLVLLLAGCATIMHGTTQSIGFSSSPTGAQVTVDNGPRGNTPLVVDLSRKDHHAVSITLDGYEPFEATITRSTSGWVWGNIVFGGLIGLAVDAISGGLYKLKPEQIAADLRTSTSQAGGNQDMLVVRVVLQPDPEWEKVGQLAVE